MSLNSKSWCSLKTAVAAISAVTTVYFPAPTSAVEMLILDKSRRDKLQRRKSQKVSIYNNRKLVSIMVDRRSISLSLQWLFDFFSIMS